MGKFRKRPVSNGVSTKIFDSKKFFEIFEIFESFDSNFESFDSNFESFDSNFETVVFFSKNATQKKVQSNGCMYTLKRRVDE